MKCLIHPQNRFCYDRLSSEVYFHCLVCTDTFADVQNLHLSISSGGVTSIVEALANILAFDGWLRTIRFPLEKDSHSGEINSREVEGFPLEMKDVQKPTDSLERTSSV